MQQYFSVSCFCSFGTVVCTSFLQISLVKSRRFEKVEPKAQVASKIRNRITELASARSFERSLNDMVCAGGTLCAAGFAHGAGLATKFRCVCHQPEPNLLVFFYQDV